MGLWSNIKSSVSNIVSGIKSVVTGKSAYQQKKEASIKKYESVKGKASGTPTLVAGKTSGSAVVSSTGSSSSSGGGGSSSRRRETISTQEIKPKTLAPIKSTDYVDKSGKSVGGLTIQGKKGGKAKVLSSNFSKKQTEKIIKSRGYSGVEKPLKSSQPSKKYGQSQTQEVMGEDKISESNFRNYNLGAIGLAGGLGLFYGYRKGKSNLSNSNFMGRNNFLFSYSPIINLAGKSVPFIIEGAKKGINWAISKTEASIPIFIGSGGSIPFKDITGGFKEVAEKETSQGKFETQAEAFSKKWFGKTSGSLEGNYAREIKVDISNKEQVEAFNKDLTNLEISKQTALSDWKGGIKYSIFSGVSKLPTSYVEWGVITAGVGIGGAVLGSAGTLASKLPAGIQFAGKVAGYGLDVSAIYFGGRTALNKNLMPSQRITGGAVATLGAFSLGAKAYRGISYLAGYPKQSTQILGISQVKQGNQVVTDIFYKTNVKNLIGSKSYYGFSRGASVIGKSDDLQTAFTITGGFYSEYKGIDLITGKTRFGKIQKFVSGGFSFSKKADVVFDAGNIPYSIEGLEGFTQFNIGKIATNKISNYYVGAGGGVKQGKLTGIFGASATNKGAGSFTGLIIQKPEEISSGVSFIQFGGSKSSQEFFNQLYGNVAQASQSSIISQIPKSPIISQSASGMLPLISAKKTTPIKEIKQAENILLLLEEDTKLNIAQVQYPLLTASQQAKGRQGSAFAQFPIQIPIQIPIQAQIPIQIQKQSYAQKNILKQISPPNPMPFIPSPYTPTPNIFLPRFDFGLQDTGLGKRRIRVKRIRGYTPSYTALIFKIRGKAPKGVETGLRIRPITEDFSFFNMFSKKRIRVKKIRRRKKK